MFRILCALFGRFQFKHTADANLDFDAELVSRHAERKAILLRRADRYEDEGLHSVAIELRRQAEAISLQRPLASVLTSNRGNRLSSKPVIRHQAAPSTNGDTNRLQD